MKALITGGGGFIGSHLVDEALHRGWEVNVLDNFYSGKRSNLEHTLSSIRLFEGDIRFYHNVLEAAKGCDVIFHQAAAPSVPISVHDPLATNSVNVDGTLTVYEVARELGISRIVQASSSAIYGNNPTQPKEENLTPDPQSPYAVSKLAMEHYADVYYKLFGLEIVSLRYFNVFGPRQDPNSHYSAVIPKFIRAIMDGTEINIHGNGKQTRDFAYIRNVVDANFTAATTKNIGSRIFNVGMQQSVSINAMLALLIEMCGRETRIQYGESRVGDVEHSLASMCRIKEELGFVPTVSFEDGLRKTVQSFLHSELPYETAFQHS